MSRRLPHNILIIGWCSVHRVRTDRNARTLSINHSPSKRHARGSDVDTVKWAREHGEIYQIWQGTERWVVLSSPEAVKEVFDKATLRVTMDVLSGGYRMLFMPYGKHWRAVRSVVHQCLTTKNADKMKAQQNLESHRYLYDILTDPDNFLDHVKRYTSSVIIYSTYGRRVTSLQDPILQAIYTETSIFVEAFGTRFMVDKYPILEKLPRKLQWWRAKYESVHQKEV
ncbi:uncharacterized protein Z518_11261 [Rhinocladiella mackenziei CBS 650.93]|uniref:Cytochrome P450 n=1 Tax=Rhinocladiella mackenziei CBS 650.93 TaxID=1442369 RepID=A0A0D2GME9_9EURO|nr:uncharacterized protein Z518_11261 [Rhinocladiella mackenziei CBS 650.93]KIW99522.1 hypothetical protein Z518_11261 [Rhinocladiella mackenziei CBS 650.93]